MEKSIADAVKTRTYVRQRVTRIYNNVVDNFGSFNESSMKVSLAKLESLSTELKILDKTIVGHYISQNVEESKINDEYESAEIYEERVLISLDRLKSSLYSDIGDRMNGGFDSGNTRSSIPAMQKIRLPEVPLPVFSNMKGESLEKFFHNFENIINKHGLSSFEKFVYLKNQLYGPPKSLVDSLDVASRNYEEAKSLLTKAFASKLTQQYSAIKSLTE